MFCDKYGLIWVVLFYVIHDVYIRYICIFYYKILSGIYYQLYVIFKFVICVNETINSEKYLGPFGI